MDETKQTKANETVDALVMGRTLYDFLRKKERYTLDQCRTVAKAIYDGVNDERERLDNIRGHDS